MRCVAITDAAVGSSEVLARLSIRLKIPESLDAKETRAS